MSPARVIASLVVFGVLLGVAFWVTGDMEDQEQPAHIRGMAEALRAMRRRGEHPGEAQRPEAPSPNTFLSMVSEDMPPERLEEAVRRFEEALAQSTQESAKRTATAPEERPVRRTSSPEEAPKPAPIFEDAAVPADAAKDAPDPTSPRHVVFVDPSGEYVVLDDDTTWRVAEAGRETTRLWMAGTEVPPGAERLRAPDGAPIGGERVLGKTGRLITTVAAKGATVTLDDDSIWHVAVEDRAETQAWAAGHRMVVLPDVLLDLERGSKVSAHRVR